MRFVFVVCLLAFATTNVPAQDAPARRPQEFAIIFNMGYAGDRLPQDDASFEKLVIALKEARFNTILGKHTDAREAICKKHGLKIMVDLLVSEHHIYKSPEEAKKLCTQLQKSDSIYAYHLWSDNIAGTADGRNRDIANVHQWDPRHPTYVGTYNARGLESLKDPDIIGYYDFHWKRGGHFRHLTRTHEVAKKTDSRFLCYIDAAPGLIGKGNYNRVLYTVSTSMAFGLKGYTYHCVGQEIDQKTWTWNQLGKDLTRVNVEAAALGSEHIKLGNPVAVYSTSISKSEKNDPIEKPTIPAGLPGIPADFPVQIVSGEVLMGVYPGPGEKGRTLFFANHNAYEPQALKLRLPQGTGAEQFDRQKLSWMPMTGELTIAPAGATLVRLRK